MILQRRGAKAQRGEKNKFSTVSLRLRVESSSPAGFTLIEVMAALAILVLFLVPLLGAVSQGLQFVGRAQQRTKALQLAQDKLADVMMAKVPEAEETKDGDFGRENQGFHWEVEAVRPPVLQLLEKQFPGLKAMEMHVRVRYDEGGSQHVIQLDGIVME